MGVLIRVMGLHYHYLREGEAPIQALRGVDLTVQQGDYVAVLGHNGSGKSTLAKCLNGLLLPTEGDVWVKGRNTFDLGATQEVRSTVGLVLQNPDNQFVSTVVEEEVAFGPENLGLARDELSRRVEQALVDVGLSASRGRNPQHLSAGEKARLAIASILAMRPDCLVLDESTAMLDPLARGEVLALLRRLNSAGLTVVAITHSPQEATEADDVVILDRGRIAAQGTPREVFAQGERLAELAMELPPAAAIAHTLAGRGVSLPEGLLGIEEVAWAAAELAGERRQQGAGCCSSALEG